jgi:putative transcriptional regulator
MTKTHPTSDMLAAYASGNISDGMELFIRTHLNYCPKCRKAVLEIEEIAGSILKNDLSGVNIDPPSYETTKKKLFAHSKSKSTEQVASKPIDGGKLPRIINNLVGKNSNDINWRFRLPGIYDYLISKENGEEISLLKAEPGAKIFQHTHEGSEATLVLCGTMKDEAKFLKAGDISIVDQTSTHNPEIVGDETCICLIVMTGKVKFTGRFTRAFNLLN